MKHVKTGPFRMTWAQIGSAVGAHGAHARSIPQAIEASVLARLPAYGSHGDHYVNQRVTDLLVGDDGATYWLECDVETVDQSPKPLWSDPPKPAPVAAPGPACGDWGTCDGCGVPLLKRTTRDLCDTCERREIHE